MKLIDISAELLVPVFGMSATNIDPHTSNEPEATLAVRSGGTALLEAGFMPSVWFTDNKVLGKQGSSVIVVDCMRAPDDPAYKLILGTDERLATNNYPYYSVEQTLLQPLERVQDGTADVDDGIEAMHVVVGDDEETFFSVYYA